MVLLSACTQNPDPSATRSTQSTIQITLVDHANLRRFPEDPAEQEAAIRALRRNFDAARARGIQRYLLFANDFESLLTYDFALEDQAPADGPSGAGPAERDPGGQPGPDSDPDKASQTWAASQAGSDWSPGEDPGPEPRLGNRGVIGAQAFLPDSPWRIRAQQNGDLLRWAIDEAAARGIALVYHTNQFDLPGPVFELLREDLGEGKGICPDRPAVWPLYRGKLREFFRAFPGLAGLQVTADEAAYSVLDCRHPPRGMSPEDSPDEILARVDRLVNETAAVAAEFDVAVEARSWGRIYALDEEIDPARMFENLDPRVHLSLKNTRGDFHVFSPASPLIGQGDGARQIIEFDAWREHEGWNLYPCYMGEIWAPRLRAAHAAGLRQLAVRIGWDEELQPLFEKPWGNLINLEMLQRLARDPAADPDALLRAIIAETWPEAAREAAFALYQQSPDFLATVHGQGGEAATDHSRLFRMREGDAPFDRVDSRLHWLGKAGQLRTPADFEARRAAIDAVYAEAQALIAALGDDTPADWRTDLARGARAQWRVGRGATDQLELRFWTREDVVSAGEEDSAGGDSAEPSDPSVDLRAQRLAELTARARADNADWEAEDRELYAMLKGDQLPAMLDVLGF